MLNRRRVFWAGLLLVMVLPGAAGCGAGEPSGEAAPAGEKEGARQAETAPPPGMLVPNGRMPFEGVLTGGQPTQAQLEKLADLGYGTVINMRMPGEEGSTDPAAVEALGMAYVSIPLPGAAGITEENARKLAEALDEAEHPVLIHCASGNRIGAILGMKAWAVDGRSPQEALEIARSAGITRLEPALREILELQEPAPE